MSTHFSQICLKRRHRMYCRHHHTKCLIHQHELVVDAVVTLHTSFTYCERIQPIGGFLRTVAGGSAAETADRHGDRSAAGKVTIGQFTAGHTIVLPGQSSAAYAVGRSVCRTPTVAGQRRALLLPEVMGMNGTQRYGWAAAVWTCTFFIVGTALALVGWHGTAAAAFLVGAWVEPKFLRRWFMRQEVGERGTAAQRADLREWRQRFARNLAALAAVRRQLCGSVVG